VASVSMRLPVAAGEVGNDAKPRLRANPEFREFSKN
jgi:hypothetical protein